MDTWSFQTLRRLTPRGFLSRHGSLLGCFGSAVSPGFAQDASWLRDATKVGALNSPKQLDSVLCLATLATRIVEFPQFQLGLSRSLNLAKMEFGSLIRCSCHLWSMAAQRPRSVSIVQALDLTEIRGQANPRRSGQPVCLFEAGDLGCFRSA